MKNIYLFCVLLCSSLLSAQYAPLTPSVAPDVTVVGKERFAYPNTVTYYQLAEIGELEDYLRKTAQFDDPRVSGNTQLVLPDPAGNPVAFKVFRYRMLSPEMERAFPNFYSLYGWDVENPGTRIHLDWTALGLRASVIGGEEGRWNVEPVFRGELDRYQSYSVNDHPKINAGKGDCGFVPNEEVRELVENFGAEKVGDCQLREYRLAISCTGEYYQTVGGPSPTDETVLSEIMNAINRVNEVTRQDLALTLIIINGVDEFGSTNLLFDNGATDPFSNDMTNAMLAENQATVDMVIGTENYDVGHVFSTSNGGVASLASPCNADRKAQGVTGLPNPIGDPFYIDFVAHELGHQFGGNHTFNSFEVNCIQRNSNTSWEPGGGTTIQGYAGICGPTANIQLNSDPYYHAGSIQEMSAYMELGFGSTCANVINTTNTEPTVAAMGTEFSIPTNTPFVLEATGMDADGSTFTYCWEQFDTGNSPVPGIPTGLESSGPLFRSLPPVADNRRFFPSLEKVVTGNGSPWEVLPGRSREMNFIVTAREAVGAAGYACTVQDEVKINVIDTDEQYAVTSPNGGEQWLAGSTQMVTWEVAGTNANGINCAQVEVFLSTDGGVSFPTALGTFPNNGAASITVPTVTELDARIMVKCAGNIFFDVSDMDFSIESVDFAFTAASTSSSTCSGTPSYAISLDALQGYTGTVMLSASGAPAGTTVTINPTTVSFTNGGATTEAVAVMVTGAENLADGDYSFTLSADDGSSAAKDLQLSFTVDGDFALNEPVDGQVNPLANGSSTAGLTVNFDPVAGSNDYTLFIQDVLISIPSFFAGSSFDVNVGGLSPGSTRDISVRANPSGQLTCLATVTFGEAGTATTGRSLTVFGSGASACEGRQITDDLILTFTNGDLTGPATLTASGLPPGVTVDIDEPTLESGESTLLFLNGEENLAAGEYSFQITASDGAATESATVDFLMTRNDVIINTPVDGSQVMVQSIIGCPNDEGVVVVFDFEPYTGPGTAVNYRVVFTDARGTFAFISQPNDTEAVGLCAQDGAVVTYRVDALDGAGFVLGSSCEASFTAVDQILPVEWTQFTAIAAGKVAELNWSVVQDAEHESFRVERNTEGADDWETISSLNRTAPNGPAAYAYTDPSVELGQTYNYRIRQQDVDGTTDYSPIRSVTFGSQGASLRVFPNPASNLLTVVTNPQTLADNQLNYELFTSLGQRVQAGALPGIRTEINLTNLPVGIYQLRVTDGASYNEVIRVVKR